MVYSGETGLCSIYVEPTYSSEIVGVDNIKIWFNEALADFFPSFQAFGDQDYASNPVLKVMNVLFIPNITNVQTINGVQYLIAEEEYRSLFLWNDFKSLIFETSMPVITENNGAQKNEFRQILTDFEPLEAINDRSAIQYYPQGSLRFYEMTSNYPLNRVSVRISWETKSGSVFPIRLNNKDVLTMKIYFKKKGVMIDY